MRVCALKLPALKIPSPIQVIAHGWWTVDGEKISKTRGNVVDPLKIIQEFGLDTFRYFLLRQVPFGYDGDFSLMAFINRINSDLANDLGNLLNRTHNMIMRYRAGIVPENFEPSPLKLLAPEILHRVDMALNNFAYDVALKSIWDFVHRTNKFIDETMPWKLANDNSQASRLDYVLLNLFEALRFTSLLIAPFMPDTSKRIFSQLGLDEEPVNLLYKNFEYGAGAGSRLNKSEVLFPRIDIKERQRINMQQHENTQAITPENKPEATSEANQENTSLITIEDFAKLEMRVAQVINVEQIPRSKKLYKLEVDLGYEKRIVCSGIKAFFRPEELLNKRVILVTNLKPVKLCGIESNGMILAASVKHDGIAEKLTLLTPLDENIPLGSKVS